MAKKQTIYEIKVKGLDDIKSLNTEISKLNGNYDKLSKESGKASKSTGDVGKESKTAVVGIGKLAKGAAAATAALVAFNKISKVLTQQIKEGVQVFKGFEFEMAKVKAISGANDAEFRKLNKTAQELGRSTFFTAQQVAALQLNFSKLGFTSAEVLQVQEAALLAATATGEDLARTATVIGSTVRGFGLDATEGARVADVMAASFTQSALTLEKFQTSMTKVSSVAKLLGFDLEETSAIMGVLTDAGIEASIAGTSLRNIFLKLGDPSSDLAKSIGFTVNNSEDMVREFRRMRDEGVNVEEMLKIVDVRQVQAIANMIKHIDKIEQQTEAYRNSEGAAGDMSKIIGDTLQGSTLRFQSALDGLRIVLVEKIAPALTHVLDQLAGFFNRIAEGASPMKTNIELMEEQQKLFEKEIQTLITVNDSEDARRIVIKRINKEFKDYLPNLLSEKDNLDDITKASDLAVLAMQKRIVAMQFEQEQREILDARRAASAEIANQKILKAEGKLASQRMEKLQDFSRPDELTALKNLEEAQMKMNQEILENTDDSIEKLKEKYKIMAQELGFTFADLFTGGEAEDEGVEGSKANVDEVAKKQAESMSAIMRATQEIVAEERFELQKKFLDGEIATREEYDEILLQKQSEFLSQALAMDVLTTEERMKLTDMLHKVKMQQMKEEKDAEVDRIKQMKETGKLLMQIGEAEGENSKVKQAGIKITQAAAVAEGIQGLINAQTAITKQASSGDPFTAFARIAAMAAMLASVIVNIKSLIGGGGGGESSEGEERFLQGQNVQFEKGGLTRGGMFKGASHANGGVKFRVGGAIHEAEGGEAIINKKSTARFRPILSAINSYNGNGVKFADGGIISQGEKFAVGGELRSVQSMISGSTTQKVVLVESDVTDTQNRISALESQSSF